MVAMARTSRNGEWITPAAAPECGPDATGALEQLVEVEPAQLLFDPTTVDREEHDHVRRPPARRASLRSS